MFGWISKSAYEKANKRISELEYSLREEEQKSEVLRKLWYNAVDEKETEQMHIQVLQAEVWRLNTIIKRGEKSYTGASQFTQEELRSLIQLVHPDKHDGKASAVAMTQKINKLRG